VHDVLQLYAEAAHMEGANRGRMTCAEVRNRSEWASDR